MTTVAEGSAALTAAYDALSSGTYLEASRSGWSSASAGMPAHHFGASSSFQISHPATRPAKRVAARDRNDVYAAIAAGVVGGLPGSPTSTNTGLTPIRASSSTGPSNCAGSFVVNMKKRAVLAFESQTSCMSALEKGSERFIPGSAAAWAAAGATSSMARQSRGRKRRQGIEGLDRLGVARS